jgi:hypothetical protein
MNPRALQNNGELFDYLVFLADRLERLESQDLADVVRQASRFAAGSVSEFMHEAQLALDRVLKLQPAGMAHEELQDAISVQDQIKEAFRSIGGA